jgi:uncharacterized phage protein (TIGR01671 family)
MRQLKFRAYDNINKEWLLGYKECGGFSISGLLILMGEWQAILYKILKCEFGEDGKELFVQQYTGSQDKNGVEIYEGDILAADHDGGEGEANIGVVFYAAGTFMIDGDGPFYDHVYGHSPDILGNHSVIGNKFENPELLKA